MNRINSPGKAHAPKVDWDDATRSPHIPWQLIDRKFSKNRIQYISQCVLSTLVILSVLLILDTVTQTVLIASFGASVFICFTMPHVKSSGPRYVIGGYIVGTAIGCFASLMTRLVPIDSLPVETTQIIFGAIATGVAIFCMVITDTEHPPAAGLALGFVLNEWEPLTILVILAGIIFIFMMKEVSKKNMINLL